MRKKLGIMTPPELPWGIYIRTSTFDQGERSSPLKQFSACLAWAKANDKVIPGADSAIVSGKVQRGAFVFVDAQSGTNDDRPDLQRFMALAKTGKIGGIVCYVVDRAARNLNDAIKIHRDLKRMKVGFKFALQHFDEGPAGMLMFQVFAAFAEYECKLIAERTHDGRKKRILGIGKGDGKPRLQGAAQYGYHLEDGIPVEDKVEGPAARLMLRKALEGLTCGRIAKVLNEAGHRTREGLPFNANWVAPHLREAHNYAGIYRHHHGIQAARKAYQEAVKLMGSDAPPLDLDAIEVIEVEAYPPMITREEANLILARAEKNRIEKRGRPTSRYALAHYVWCDVCNCRWYAGKGRYYCACVQLGKPRCGAIGEAPQQHMEAAVLNGMRAYLRRPEVCYALALEDYNLSRGSSKRDRPELEKQVKETARRQMHYDEQVTAFDLTQRQREIAKKKSQELELKLAELNAELRQTAVVPLPSRPAIAAAFAQTLDLLDRIETFEEKRRFVELTVQKILTDGRRVKVTGTLDVETAANTASGNGSYSMSHLDAPLIKSSPIPFTFNAPIPGQRRPGRRKVA